MFDKDNKFGFISNNESNNNGSNNNNIISMDEFKKILFISLFLFYNL